MINRWDMEFLKDKKFKVITTSEAQEEDWKTALAHHIKPIPKGVELVCTIFTNLYGTYLSAEYRGRNYNIDPKICDFVEVIGAR